MKKFFCEDFLDRVWKGNFPLNSSILAFWGSKRLYEIFQIFLLLASIHVIILTSALGSILLSKHLTFCHPRLILPRLHSHLAFLLRSHLSERREKNAIGRKKSSCRKFMNKFKDAIYGLRKEIAIPNFLCSSNKRKVTEFMNSKWQFSPAIVHDDEWLIESLRVRELSFSIRQGRRRQRRRKVVIN